jgi:hypothetical protein
LLLVRDDEFVCLLMRLFAERARRRRIDRIMLGRLSQVLRRLEVQSFRRLLAVSLHPAQNMALCAVQRLRASLRVRLLPGMVATAVRKTPAFVR